MRGQLSGPNDEDEDHLKLDSERPAASSRSPKIEDEDHLKLDSERPAASSRSPKIKTWRTSLQETARERS